MYINMHFLLDSKCLSTEPTENFQITYDKMWINNELIFSLLNYGNNLPKHRHYSSSLIPYNNMPVAGLLIELFSLGSRTRSEPSFHSLHCISKTASPNTGWWRKTSNLSCRYTELIAEHINESHKYIPIYQEALIPAVLWLLLYVFPKDCLVKMLTYTGLPSTYVQQHKQSHNSVRIKQVPASTSWNVQDHRCGCQNSVLTSSFGTFCSKIPILCPG